MEEYIRRRRRLFLRRRTWQALVFAEQHLDASY